MRIPGKIPGNGANVLMPEAGTAAAKLAFDQPLDIREEARSSVIEPIRAWEFDLAVLLASIGDENLHAEVDVGPLVGQERW